VIEFWFKKTKRIEYDITILNILKVLMTKSAKLDHKYRSTRRDGWEGLGVWDLAPQPREFSKKLGNKNEKQNSEPP
jgi:hypothetical protein